MYRALLRDKCRSSLAGIPLVIALSVAVRSENLLRGPLRVFPLSLVKFVPSDPKFNAANLE